jgi:hypothetical protein
MGIRIKNSINRLGLTVLVALTALVLATGCIGWYVHHPDPLAGWKFCYSDNPVRSNKTISDDYQKYISTLSQREQKSIGSIDFYEDTTGQHAVRITILLDGTYWNHILVYDKDNNRIRVIKYVGGHYMS